MIKNLVQSTVWIEVCMSKWLEEAHMVGVSVDDVNVVGVLCFDHQLRVVAKPLRGFIKLCFWRLLWTHQLCRSFGLGGQTLVFVMNNFKTQNCPKVQYKH